MIADVVGGFDCSGIVRKGGVTKADAVVKFAFIYDLAILYYIGSIFGEQCCKVVITESSN